MEINKLKKTMNDSKIIMLREPFIQPELPYLYYFSDNSVVGLIKGDSKILTSKRIIYGTQDNTENIQIKDIVKK